MRNLAPKMQQLKDRFGDDRQKMSQAMMELYRKEKVNPMGGCLPLLLPNAYLPCALLGTDGKC